MPSSPASTGVATLRHVVESHALIWVFCRWCGHAERRDPRPIAERVGLDAKLRDLAPAFRCERCGSKKAVVFRSLHTTLVRTQRPSR